MSINSRVKGKGYELEIASLLREYGYEGRRTGQRQAQIGDGSPDVDGLPGYHIECKRVARIGRVYDWIEQADRTCQSDAVSIVFCRGNNKESLVILRARDFLDLIADEEQIS